MSNDFYEQTVLPNGLRILTSTMPHTHSVSLSLYVGTGSRYERDEQAGISHFLEHMLFKGTEKRRTAKEIAEAIDGVGGAMNGGTDREYTIYYIKVAKPHRELAMDILMEMVRRPLIEQDEVEKERHVILEELAMVEDNPSQIADLLLDSIMWPQNPLGRDVAGTPESVAAIDRESMLAYLHDQYRSNNIVVSVAGNVSHSEIVEQVTAGLGDWESGGVAALSPAPSVNGTRCAVQYKKTEQAHFALGVRTLARGHKDRYVQSVLSTILGGNMSSRLFSEVREKRGLAYYIRTGVGAYHETGHMVTQAGVTIDKIEEAIKAVMEQYQKVSKV
ncbi:MAG: M16 family metallopeptidase, partial [Dehalococcoidia bacterium]